MRRACQALAGLSLLLVPWSAFALGFGANERADGGQPGAFIEAAASARPLAMGGAFVAIADDATAPFWNASGLAQIQRFDVVANYNRLGTDASIGAGAFAVPTRGFGTFAVNVITLRSGSYQRRDAQNTHLGQFENNAAAYLFSQGFNVGTRGAAGYTLKAVREQIDDRSDTGFGADIGLMFRPQALWQLGLAVQNALTPSLRLKSETEKFSREVRVGSRYSPIKRLALSADLSFVGGQNAELSLGTEWRVAEPLALRLGANDREFSAGVGVSAGDLGIDYAFGLPHADIIRNDLGAAHRVSFHLAFGSDVMQGSYLDLTRRRNEQQREIVRERRGVDHLETLRRKMPDWDGKMDVSTFEDVQQVRQSLRQMAFSDPAKADEAQAYVLHFQGQFTESALLFDKLAANQPRNRRLRKHAEIAGRRARSHPAAPEVAPDYKRLDDQDHDRHEEHATQMAVAVQEAADSGGSGASAAQTVQEAGSTAALAPIPPLVPPVDPAPRNEPEASAKIEEAKTLLAGGDYVAAHLAAQQALEAAPENRDAVRQAILTNAMVAAQASLSEARATVDRAAVEKTVDESIGIFDEGMKSYRAGMREDAVLQWEHAVQVCPANFLARKMMDRAEVERLDEEFRHLRDGENRRRG